MQKVLLFTLVALIILPSCKKTKDKEETPVSLTGKWNVQSTIIKSFENGVLTDTYTLRGNGATIDFQTNGNAVISHDGVVESHPYTIQAGSKVEIEGDTYEIRNLTANSVTLFLHDNYSASAYAEIEQGLKR